MKIIMRKRFVPRHYYRDLHNHFQEHKQGSRSVKVIEMVKRQVEEKNGGEECQLEILPLKIIFEDLCINQQNEEIKYLSGKNYGKGNL